MAIEKIDAIFSLVPNADCALTGGVITVWNSEEAQPTEEEITAEMEKLQAEYDALAWKRNRQSEYPSLQDCIHALLDGGDTLTDLQAARQAVKDAHPKPGE
tara:strand:- start:495 stop:797 length:303 start_codon:yes stop_codon:yes gene_type:complete